MRKFKKRFLKFSCIISTVMVLTFTVISPFVCYSASAPYPEAKIPLTWNQKQTDIYIHSLTAGDYYLDGETWFSDLTSAQTYGSFWYPSQVKLQWFLGRMSYVSISMDTGWDMNPPKLDPRASYKLHLNYSMYLYNYRHDGVISITTYAWFQAKDNPDFFHQQPVIQDTFNDGSSELGFYNASTGFYNVDYTLPDVWDGYFDYDSKWQLECIEVELSWTYDQGSSGQGGFISFTTDNSYLLPYYENSEDVPIYPDYDNNQDLNDYNDKVGQADQFVEGNLDSVSNMFANGLSYLTGNFRNTMLYVGSVMTTLTNSKFFSVLVPISLSIGFIAFLLTGVSILSSSIRSRNAKEHKNMLARERARLSNSKKSSKSKKGGG